MAHGASTDKGGATAVLDLGVMTAHAVVAAKNIIAQEVIDWPGETPARHKVFWFMGTTVPDNTDYPDSIAPIGSEYKRLIITDGAVSGCMNYLKTAAGTWAEIGDVT